MRYVLILGCLMITSCLSVPDGVVPVKNFELDRYPGRWYEIARLDHSFERDLEDVSANYSLKDDGGIKVINSSMSKTNKAIRQSIDHFRCLYFKQNRSWEGQGTVIEINGNKTWGTFYLCTFYHITCLSVKTIKKCDKIES